jgi:hypothetical protein
MIKIGDKLIIIIHDKSIIIDEMRDKETFSVDVATKIYGGTRKIMDQLLFYQIHYHKTYHLLHL